MGSLDTDTDTDAEVRRCNILKTELHTEECSGVGQRQRGGELHSGEDVGVSLALDANIVCDFDAEDYEALVTATAEKSKTRRNYTGRMAKEAFAGFSSQEKIEKVFKLMHCSLCDKTCPPDCKTCLEGHLLCNTCSEFVPSCPFEIINDFGSKILCKSKVTEFKLKSYAVVHANVQAKMRCEFWKDGCEEILEEDRLKCHEELCKFSPQHACPVTTCETGELNVGQLIHHLVESHLTQFITNEKIEDMKLGFGETSIRSTMKSNEHFSWAPAIFSFHDANFILAFEKVLDKLYFAFYWLESPSSSSEGPTSDGFQIELKLRDTEGEKVTVWRSAPSSFDTPSDLLIKSDKALSMTVDDFLEKFVDEKAGETFNTCRASVQFQLELKEINLL